MEERGRLNRAGFLLGDRWVVPAANEIDGVRVDPKSMDVLVALAESAPDVLSGDMLLERVWPSVVVVGNVVYQAIAQIRKALRDEPRTPRYIETISRRGYRLIAKVEREGADLESSAATNQRAKSIAVLPFVNMSSDAEQEYFSDGISEELMSLLTKIPELHVISRTSAFFYKGKQIKLPELARELNVGHVLQGSVRRADDRVRITVQLIDARTDMHQWSDTYDRTLDDVFAIQDEIAATVVNQLKIVLFGEAPKVTRTDARAYELYLKGRQLYLQGSRESIAQSFVLYERALEVDPTYAAAWTGLAAANCGKLVLRLPPFEGCYLQANELVHKALALDPEHAPAHGVLGMISMQFDGDLPAAARHFENALRLEPTNTDILVFAAWLLADLGRFDRAIEVGEYVVARDPLNPIGHGNLGMTYLLVGQVDQGVASYRTALRLSPGFPIVHYVIALGSLMKGDVEAARQELSQESSEAYRLAGAAIFHEFLHQQAESDAALSALILKDETLAAYHVACLYAIRNDADGAFEWLRKATANRQMRAPDLIGISVNAMLTSLHGDERWEPFLKSIGRSKSQLDSIQFDVTLPTR